MNQKSVAQRAQIVRCLVEGNSIRSTVRMTGASKNTIAKLLVELGTACAQYQDETLRGLKTENVQCDEIWSFVGMKEKDNERSLLRDIISVMRPGRDPRVHDRRGTTQNRGASFDFAERGMSPDWFEAANNDFTRRREMDDIVEIRAAVDRSAPAFAGKIDITINSNAEGGGIGPDVPAVTFTYGVAALFRTRFSFGGDDDAVTSFGVGLCNEQGSHDAMSSGVFLVFAADRSMSLRVVSAANGTSSTALGYDVSTLGGYRTVEFQVECDSTRSGYAVVTAWVNGVQVCAQQVRIDFDTALYPRITALVPSNLGYTTLTLDGWTFGANRFANYQAPSTGSGSGSGSGSGGGSGGGDGGGGDGGSGGPGNGSTEIG